jgi:phosphoserine aminotransferase
MKNLQIHFEKPQEKPLRPFFSSGPCAKRPGWSVDVLKHALLGRSHRSQEGYAKLQLVLQECRSLLGIPDDYLIGLTPGSDTSAFEMGLWSMIGALPVEALVFDAFGALWADDLKKHLCIENLTLHKTSYGHLPDLEKIDAGEKDIVFCWNGTTSGVVIPNGDWIPDTRKGLTFCDAISAAFAYDLPWEKLDVTTFSWQKVLGSEAQHGMIVLSPRAQERLKTYIPDRPLPKIFRLASEGKINLPFFEGATLNTPSLLCVEDVLDALAWTKNKGGVEGLKQKALFNFTILEAWVQKTAWVDFVAVDPESRSHTSVCLHVKSPVDDDKDKKWLFIQHMCEILSSEKAAYDIKGHAAEPPVLRIWVGPTVEAFDIQLLLPWLQWAYEETINSLE